MKSFLESKTYTTLISVFILIFIATSTFSKRAYGFPEKMRQEMLGGPWEIVVQTGMDSSMMSFPVKVADENKTTMLNKVLPMIGSPIKIRLIQYIPDLKWDTSIVKVPKGAAVAKIKAKGANLDQDIWLSSADPAKQSISSQLGGVKILELDGSKKIENIMQELTSRKSIGIISVRDEKSNKPFEYIVNTGDTIILPKSDYKLKVLQYLPHFTVDTTTKKATTQSNKPLNPAIKINLDNGRQTYEQWLWSKFPSFAHTKQNLPFQIKFFDFDIENTPNHYILVAKEGSEPWLFYLKDGKSHAEKAKLKHEYPFAKKIYNFSIEEFENSANIKKTWKNGSDKLLSPAIIATVEENNIKNQLILELKKPNHHRSASGTMVLLYRRQKDSSGVTN